MKQSLRTNRLFCALSLSLSFLLTGCSFLTGDKQFNSAENGQNETNKLSSNPQIKQESPEYWRAATLSKEDVAQSYGPLFVSLSDDFVYGMFLAMQKIRTTFPLLELWSIKQSGKNGTPGKRRFSIACAQRGN